MTVYSYAIATFAAGTGALANLETLTGLTRPPHSIFTLYPVEYTGGDGRTVGDGQPTCTWTFDSLSQAQVNALRAFVLSGATYLQSASVYITTRKDDGTYSNFLAWLHWPRDFHTKRVLGGYYEGIEITFTNLVQQA